MAFSVKIKADDIARFYHIGLLCHIKYCYHIPVIIKTYNDTITGRKGDVEKWTIYVSRIKYIV